MIRQRGAETELVITAPPVFTALWLMPRLADFAKHEPKVEVRVISSSRWSTAGALGLFGATSNLDLRDDASGVEIHLGQGDLPRLPRRQAVQTFP